MLIKGWRLSYVAYLLATSLSQNTTGNPMSTPPIPSNSRSLPIETITIKAEIISDNEQDPPKYSQTANAEFLSGSPSFFFKIAWNGVSIVH